MGVARHAQITQNNKFAISLQYLEKEVSDKIYFLHADKHESLLQIDTLTLIGIYSSIPKVSKFARWQFLYNISKKKLGMEFFFSLQMSIKVSTSWTYFLMKMARYVKSTQNSKLVIFCKECCSYFVFYCHAKYSDTLWGSSHVYCYLFSRTARLEIFCLNNSI